VRIAFDHQAFCLQRTGGISRYFCELANAILLKHGELRIFAPVYRNTYLRSVQRSNVEGFWVKDYPPYMAGLCSNLAGRWASSKIKQWRPDVLHETYYAATPRGANRIPVVLSVFDMIGELNLMGDTHQVVDIKNSPKYRAVQRADHIICISKSTQRDLVELFDVPISKTSVIYLGSDALHSNATGCLNSIESPSADSTKHKKNSKPYLLYVGLRGAYKNFATLLGAYAKSARLSKDFDLISFGADAFSGDERAEIARLGLSQSQVRHVYGADDVLIDLYRHATGFVYPSKYEGFGLPPLEAMGQDCPVISSNTSSMPEVIGDAAEYFDPYNVDEMMYAIEQVVYSPSRAEDLIGKGRVRAKTFSWGRCAAETLLSYQAVSSRSG
jgi:glycosyltransferase involved in cell wall biosynthesis